MIVGLYAVKDELSGFTPPVVCKDTDNAIRYFRYKVNTEEMLKQNPEDFSIWEVGSFDTDKGTVVGSGEPILVERAQVNKYGNEETAVQNNA